MVGIIKDIIGCDILHRHNQIFPATCSVAILDDTQQIHRFKAILEPTVDVNDTSNISVILGNVGQLRRSMSKLERISSSGVLRSCLRYLLSTKVHVVKVLVAALPTCVNTCIHRNIEIPTYRGCSQGDL